jgi:hypothetical protein
MKAFFAITLCLILPAGLLQAATTTTDFEDHSPGTSSSTGSFYNGADSAGGFTSRSTFFINSYDPTFGDWSGWSYSNVVNATTAGFGNQYASFPGGGSDASGNTVAGGIYGVAYSPDPNDAFINLPAGKTAQSVYLTNTTYAGLSMTSGDQFAKKFGPGDFFDVNLTGYSQPGATGIVTGSVKFYLANFLNGQSLIVNNWQQVDLTTLGSAESIGLSFDSSDVGQFGINTPTYAAMDNLVLAPEPTACGLVAMFGLAISRRRK